VIADGNFPDGSYLSDDVETPARGVYKEIVSLHNARGEKALYANIMLQKGVITDYYKTDENDR
jgi:L-fucose mutarotase/ribose pyranase (RbsD/FucU family)